MKYTFNDYRIGQITRLPDNTENKKEELIKVFSNPRPRNIKKALKSGVTVRFSNDSEDMKFLFNVHKQNIESIGGKAKEYSFFEDVENLMSTDEYKILIAELDGIKIGALLLFYFNKTIEYFTPATIYEYRNVQPSSLLIYEGMMNGIDLGYSNWNWGGTWETQTGVYDFKKKWGAVDCNYEYYTMIYDTTLLKLSEEELNSEYSNVFVLPFKELQNGDKQN